MIDPRNVTNGSCRHPSGGMHTDHASEVMTLARIGLCTRYSRFVAQKG